MGRFLRPIEDGQGGGTAGRIDPIHLLQVPLGLGQFPLQLLGLGREHRLLDGAGEEGVEQPLLHPLQLRLPLGEGLGLLPLLAAEVGERRLHRRADQPTHIVGLQPHAAEFLGDGPLQLLLAPADAGMLRAGVVVGAAVIGEVLDRPVGQHLLDPLAGNGLAAVGAAEQPAGERVVGGAGAAVLALEDGLAGVEEFPVDKGRELALAHLAAPHDVADVDAVVEDVGQDGAEEPRGAGPVDVALGRKQLAERLEGHVPARVQLEDADDDAGLLRVRLDRLFSVARDVHIAEGRQAGGPALADLLVDPLEHFGAEVVGVILSDRRHDVERQQAGRTGAKLVLDEGELHAAVVLKFLHPHRVTHIAADAVELVGEDHVDALALGVLAHPAKHLVEHQALGAAFGRLGDHELADHRNALARGLVAVGPELRVQGIAFLLLA